MANASLARQIAVLRRAFPSERMPQETVELYLERLADIEPALLEAAVSRLVDEARFLPKIAEVRHVAAKLAGLLPPTAAEALALVQIADVREAKIRRDGSFAYEERYWRWPEHVRPELVALCCDVLTRAGDPVDERSGKDRFGWEQGFRQTYDAAAGEYKLRVLADLSAARLPGPRPAVQLPARAAAQLPAPPSEEERQAGIAKMRELAAAGNEFARAFIDRYLAEPAPVDPS
ncbi:MAG TPA: hypothetical protein VIV56_07200 [Gemmatimonadales bacterium]